MRQTPGGRWGWAASDAWRMRHTQPKPRPFLLDLLRRLVGERPLGAASAVVVYCLNMFGDAVRNLLDPRLRGGGGGASLGSGGMSARAIEGARRALQKAARSG